MDFIGDSRLALTLSSADGAAGRPSPFSSSFYNTQGRKLDVDGAIYASIDMFIDSSFLSDPNRVAGLWGTGVDGADSATAYPIIEFANGAFQIWNGSDFDAVGLPTSFVADTFVNPAFALNTATNSFDYFLNDKLVFTDTDADGAVSLTNLIIQGYNTDRGIDRTIYFDNLMASSDIPSAAPVPVPAALPLLGSLLAAFGVISWRNRGAEAA